MNHSTLTESRFDIARSRLRKFTDDTLSCRMAGFAMSQAWIYVVLFSRGLSPETNTTSAVHSSFYDLSLVMLVGTLITAAIFAHSARKLMETPWGQWLPGILCAAGTITLPLPNWGTASDALLVVAAVTTGIGSGFLLVFWGRCYKTAGGPTAGAEAALAFVLASFVQPVLIFCPVWMRIAAAVALALGSSALLSLSVRQGILEPDQASSEEAASETDPLSRPSSPTPERTGLSSAFIKLLVSSFILGACTSTMQGFFRCARPKHS